MSARAHTVRAENLPTAAITHPRRNRGCRPSFFGKNFSSLYSIIESRMIHATARVASSHPHPCPLPPRRERENSACSFASFAGEGGFSVFLRLSCGGQCPTLAPSLVGRGFSAPRNGLGIDGAVNPRPTRGRVACQGSRCGKGILPASGMRRAKASTGVFGRGPTWHLFLGGEQVFRYPSPNA